MNKLKNKVFWTIFTILTLSLISIISIFNYQDYNKEKKSIERNLTRLQNNMEKDINYSALPNENQVDRPKEDSLKEEFSKKIFMDAIVYTIVLDENNNIKEVISNNEEEANNEKIIEVAAQLLNSKNLKK